MKKQILLIFIFITVLGCTPLYYVPNTQNVPVMEKKGQANFSVSAGQSAYTNSLEFQGAYGLTDKIALQLNGFSANSIPDSGDSFKGFGTMVEFGGGYYKKISPVFVFETYGLINFGTVVNKLSGPHFAPDSGDIKANLFRAGLQPSISYRRKYVVASFSSRIANLSYNNVRGSFSSEVDYLNSKSSYWLVEPAITLQAGFENFKLQFQYVYSFNLTDPNFSQDVDHVSIGLKLNIDTKK